MPAVRGMLLLGLLWIVVRTPIAVAGAPAIGDPQPSLLVDTGGTTSLVTALAFAPDGRTLYAAGWDKIVRSWRLDAHGQFQSEPGGTYRVPIGPGLRGAINTMALSADANWLAVAGEGVVRTGAGFQQPGYILPAESVMTTEMRRDEGIIYVFDTRNQKVRTLTGHLGSVLSLTFVSSPDSDQAPTLLSAGRDWDDQRGKIVGTVRAWDVVHGKEIARLDGLPEPVTRPALAARRSGPAAAIDAVIAWGDGNLRIWQPGSGVPARSVGDGRFNDGILPLASGNRFLTTSLGARQGNLGLWNITQDGAPEGAGTWPIVSRNDAAEILVPRAVAPAASTAGGKVDLALVVSRVVERHPRLGAEAATRLNLISLRTNDWGQSLAETELWQSGDTAAMPVLATSPASGWIAVAGDEGHSVRVYATHDILRGRPVPQQLRGVGTRCRRAAFVKNGDHLGLVLGTSQKRAPGSPADSADTGDVVLDLQAGKLLRDARDWVGASARPDGWSVRIGSVHDRVTVDLLKDQRPGNRIQLEPGEKITDYALLPASQGVAPSRPVRPTILSIASHLLGQPLLRLYNAETGEEFRELTGHTERIRSLAFSADGRFLVSAADDETVRLWSMDDVEAVLAHRGRLPGVNVRETGAGLAVARLGPETPAAVRDVLSEGDLIGPAMIQHNTRNWKSSRDFFDCFWMLPKGQRVVIHRQRPGQPAADVGVLVGQGVDERKPLLSLLLVQSGDAEQWLAWSPMGPYEASDRSVEKHLGWHFNTGEPDKPTRYAELQQYRDTYYWPGLMKQVIAAGRLPARVELPKPPTSVSLIFPGDLGQEQISDDELVLRQSPTGLQVMIHDFPASHVAAVTAQVGELPPVSLRRDFHEGWIADLADPAWKRGERPVRCVVRTDEEPPRQFTRSVRVRLQPAAPTVDTPWQPRQQVRERTITFSARLHSANGEPLIVHLGRQGQWLLKGQQVANGATLTQDVPLETGDNTIELLVANLGAASDLDGPEVVRTTFVVTRLDRAPPVITIDRVVPVAPDGSLLKAAGVAATESDLTTSRPEVSVQGHVTTASPRPRATWRVEPGHDEAPLSLLAQPGVNSRSFEQRVPLRPGRQRLVIVAQADDSDPARGELSIFYRPVLPEIVLTAPPAELSIVRDVGQPAETVEVTARLTLPRPAEPFQSEVLVNGSPLPIVPEISRDGTTIHARVPLKASESSIHICLKNSWGEERVSTTCRVHYSRLPKVVSVTSSPHGDTALADVVAVVESPPDLPLTRAEIAGVEVARDKFTVERHLPDRTVWSIAAGNVAPTNAHAVEVLVWNADGRCRVSGDAKVAAPSRPPTPPEVQLVGGGGQSVAEPKYLLGVRVRSVSPIHEVLVSLNGHMVRPLNAETAQHRQGDSFELGQDVTLQLQEGINDVKISAVNDGGRSDVERTVNYVPLPVSVGIDFLVTVARPDLPIRAKYLSNQGIVFDGQLDSGVVQLFGHLHWHDQAAAAREQSRGEVRVWVNGFQQKRVAVSPAAGDQPFHATIVLGQPTNEIELTLPGLQHDASSRLAFTISCQRPEVRRRLHLLVVSANGKDRDEMRDRALRAVKAKQDASGKLVEPLQVPGFDEVVEPRILTRVSPTGVLAQLILLRNRLDAGPPLNDVVLMYYEGGQLINSAERFRLASSAADDEQSSLGSQELSQFFDSMRGAHLVLLDVASRDVHMVPALDAWGRDSHAALMYYVWRPGADTSAPLHLIGAFERAISHASRLSDIDRLLAKSSSNVDNLVYGGILPSSLRSLDLRP